MPPGKQASESEAGARLEAMRRRVRLSRLAVWTVIAAGPIALGLALTSTPTTVAAVAAKPTATVRTTATANPAGYAQLFLAAWLRSSVDDATSAQARLAQSMAPGIDLPNPSADARPEAELVTAVRVAQRTGGRWSVTVAAQYADGSVRYYVVPVTTDRTGASFAVTGAPGVVAGPERAEAAKSPYGVTVPDGELASAVGEFLAAYLTGSAEVSRYLAPGVALSPLSPAPYTAVTVQQVSAVEGAAAAEKVPADGTRARVLARMEARDDSGRWPLAYELTFTARSGRWEISAFESQAALTGGVR